MNSQPFKLGLDVIDDFGFLYFDKNIQYNGTERFSISHPRNWPSKYFVLRANDLNEMLWKIEKIRRSTPKELEISVKHIGLRPDKNIPISKYFSEICIHQPDQSISFLSFWDATYTGKYIIEGE